MNISANFEASAHDFDWSPFPSKENGKRWVMSLKARLVEAIEDGKITEAQLQARYPDLSSEEIDFWKKSFARHGAAGLRVTRIQTYNAMTKDCN